MSYSALEISRAHAPASGKNSVNGLLLSALRTYPDRVLIHTADDETFTGAEIEGKIARWTTTLARLGVGQGHNLALLAGNRVEVLFAYHAANLLGAVFIPLHPMGSPADFAHVLRDAKVDLIIFDAGRAREVAEALEIADRSIQLLSLGPSSGAVDLVDAVGRAEDAQITVHVIDPEAIVRIAYSGGTTGVPKASQISYRALTTVYEVQLEEWEWPTEIRQLLCAPLSHSGGTCFVPTIAQGGTLFIEAGFDVVRILSAIERHRITCILLVPTMIYAILDHPRLDEFDVSSLETIFYGASPMSTARLKEAIKRFGLIFFQFYGQSEAPMTVTVLRRAEHDVSDDRRLSSCGKPVSKALVRLLDPAGREVDLGDPGELCVRGPLVMSGYVDQPEENENVFRNGWLHTGDVAVKDAEGFLNIVDRSKDMVITGGFNVYPRAVEEALESHPSVAGACVFGLPHEYWGEIIFAVVELRLDSTVSKDELLTHVRGLKGPVQTPKELIVIDKIPLTSVGKPDKMALRRRYS